MVAAADLDELRLVVWGLDSAAAREDAERWMEDEPVDLDGGSPADGRRHDIPLGGRRVVEFHEVAEDRAAAVLAGDVAW